MACTVCYEPPNNSTHKLIECPKCSYSACKTCVRTYFKDLLIEPHCMNCKVGWDPDFVVISVNKSYYNKEFKENRMANLLSLEKSRLPDTQQDAKAFLAKEEFDRKAAEIKEQIRGLKSKIIDKQTELIDLHSEYLDAKTTTGKKEFIMKCQVGKCKGYLSTGYKCELCNQHTCPKCFEHQQEGHVCDPATVETVTMIRRDSKPCPKCGIRVSKIDGCHQMWCVECNTAWDWVSGRVVNGTIHNPHYYEFLKKNGGIPRAVGDVPCGGLPNIRTIYNRVAKMADKEKSEMIIRNIGNIHQFVNHMHHIYLQLADAEPYQNTLKQFRILYILGRMDEDTFSKNIYKEHKKNLKNLKKMELIQMVDNVGTDLLQTFAQFKDDMYQAMIDLIYGFSKIVIYFNELSDKYYKLFGNTIGTIDMVYNCEFVKEIVGLEEGDVVKFIF